MENQKLRVVKRLAIIPRKIDGKWIWFQFYNAHQQLIRVVVEDSILAPGWTEEGGEHWLWDTYERTSIPIK